MSLKNVREKIVQKANDIPEEILTQWDRWYVEKNYKKNKLYKLLFFLREKGADLNKFFDQEIKESKQKKDG
ncbi:hypothetical protein C8D70_12318 [Chryseobacterium sp. CBTAP 102]|uniref:hypothetical protein n=1 Tax=Chryseobacterium sp. CBTAP 102 TaxID=2135644 RepID=UPI000D75FEF0|nr:hypothetical protein [Chryseobacterium sp. CBTAP 102]PXW07103.1 hypothetical protein C8D70_12318 [Chryseobacterium sp. CBTAP 102]